MSAASDETNPVRSDNRLPLLVAALVGVEGVILLFAAVFLLVESVRSDQGNLAAGLSMAANCWRELRRNPEKA